MTLDPFWSQRVSCCGDRGVLIDHRLDLHRAVDQLLLGKLVKEHLPVFGEIASGGHPGDHVVSLLRRERRHEKVLELVASGELHQDVIGLHGRDLARVVLVGEHPEVLAVVVDLRIRHVECSVLVGLDGEEILRIPQMRFQIRRKLIQVHENARKRTPVDRQDGVVRIHDVEPDGSVVHVHNDLHGVSNVVQPLLKGRRVRTGVGKVIRDGVGILDPVLFALAHHGVGILVEA